MSKSIAVPEDLYDKAVEIAARDHISVEEFVSQLLASRLANREYIQTRAQLFSRKAFERLWPKSPTWNRNPMIASSLGRGNSTRTSYGHALAGRFPICRLASS